MRGAGRSDTRVHRVPLLPSVATLPASLFQRSSAALAPMAHTMIWEGVDREEKKKSYIINYANSEAFTDQLEFMESIGRTNLDKTIKPGGARLLSLTPLRRDGPSGGGVGSRQGASESEQSQVSANISQRQEQMRSELMTYSDTLLSQRFFSHER